MAALFKHFASQPWRVPLYCLVVAVIGVCIEIVYMFGSIGWVVMSILVVLGLLLAVGLAGYIVAINSLSKNQAVAKFQVVIMVLLSITHLIGTIWYWFICVTFIWATLFN